MSMVTNSQSTGSPATPTSWEALRVLLEEQRADCVRQRELALAEAATSMPDPVAMRRGASMLLTIAEIDAALDRIADGTYGRCTHCGSGSRSSGWSSGRTRPAASPARPRCADRSLPGSLRHRRPEPSHPISQTSPGMTSGRPVP